METLVVTAQLVEHWREAHIARAAAISRTRAYEIFRERAGTSPADYLIEHRVMKAEELLAETDLPMSEVARRCGFSSPSYLAKTFRDRCGQTPTEARERLRRRKRHVEAGPLTEARERLRRRKRHVEAGPLTGVAPGLTMAALGMSYLPEN